MFTFIILKLEIPSARSWTALVRATGMVQKRQPVHVQNHTCRVNLLRPPRRTVVLGQPSSLRPHWTHHRPEMKVNEDNSVRFSLIHIVISNISNSAARNCPLQRENEDGGGGEGEEREGKGEGEGREREWQRERMCISP